MAFTSQPGFAQPGQFQPGSLDNGTAAVSALDTASGNQSQSISALLNLTDSASGAQNQSITARLNSSDAASGSGSQSIVVHISSSDSSSSVESVAFGITLSSSDSSSVTETVRVAFSAASDAASGTEGNSITASLSSSDSGSGLDAQSVLDLSGTTPHSSDSASGSDNQSIAASSSSSDAGSSSELFSIHVSGSDTGQGVEHFYISVNSNDASSGAEILNSHVQGVLDADAVSVSESYSIAVTLSDMDEVDCYDSNAPLPTPPIEVGDYQVTLVMGPATIYVADFGSPEPLDSDIFSVPSGVYWTDIGATIGGVDLTVKQEFEDFVPTQLTSNTSSRLRSRSITVATAMAEPNLVNFLYAVNSGSLESGTGYQSYSPPVLDQATVLPYRAVIIDGWAPGIALDGKHKKRRVILRKCLSVEDSDIAYTKDKTTVQTLSWATHRNGSTPPFKVIDEA